MSAEPLDAFVVGVVGPDGVMTSAELERLVELLVNRHVGARRIVLATPGGADGPDLGWAHARRWSVTLAYGPTPLKREFELLALCDALVVLGDPGRWRRLLALAAEARIPVRCYRTRPAFLPPRQPDPLDGL